MQWIWWSDNIITKSDNRKVIQKEKVGMIFKPCIEFSKILTTINKKSLTELLVEGADRQIKSACNKIKQILDI